MQGQDVFSATSGGAYTEPKKLFGGVTYTSFKEVKRRLSFLNRDLSDGSVKKNNYLGVFKLNPTVMMNERIALGFDNNEHKMVRPYMDHSLWGNHKSWSEKEIEWHIKEYLSKKKVIQISEDLLVLTIHILFNFWLRAPDFSEDDSMNFRSHYQNKRLIISILPEYVAKILSPFLGTSNILHYQKEIFENITQLIKLQYNASGETKNFLQTDKKALSLIVKGVLDAITFAGGIGVPTLLHHCLAVLHNARKEGEGIRLNPNNVKLFILETARLYPAVNAVSYDRVNPSGSVDREILSLGTAFRDPLIWGKDAHLFKIRELTVYKNNLGAWNEWAGSHHSCPGKDMSMSIISNFLLQLDGLEWKGPDAIVPQFGYTFGSFNISVLK